MNTTRPYGIAACIATCAAALLLLTRPATAQDDLRSVPDPDPQRQLESFHVAEGFEINLFAAEPLIEKPIQFNWDEQGRLWVAGSAVYPQPQPGQPASDKIFVLEDTDGDGRADRSTVFADDLFMPTGLLPGDGGVYVANATEILHLRDTDGDGRADARRVVVSGFGVADTHHLIHTFRWGPDGRLYFNQSIYIFSHVETPWGVRRLEGGGFWRLQPSTLRLDVYARGMYNPWGLRFDAWGQSFATDGAGYEGINFLFPGAAFAAARDVDRILPGLNPNQPKFSGLEIVSGRHFPASWAGSLVTNDFRGNRVQRFVLEATGSGYVSRQVEDLVWTDHVAFRPVDVSVGPDGALYIADWYNPIIQHGEVDFRDPRRDHRHGRIWRITARDRPLVEPPDLAAAGPDALLDALTLPEQWTRDQARRLLKEHGPDAVRPALASWVAAIDPGAPEASNRLLEALWLNQAMDVVEAPLLQTVLQADDPRVRAAAVRVLYDWYDGIEDAEALLEVAVADSNAAVRREAVIALRRCASAEAARLALAVLDRPMDDFLDYALWQTVRELAPHWLPRLDTEPGFLGDLTRTVYALKSVGEPDAVRRLVALYKDGTVPEAYTADVLDVMARHADAAALGTLLDLALAPEDTARHDREALLGVLEAAARDRNLAPSGDLLRLRPLLDGAPSTRASAARLTGRWGLRDLGGRLAAMAEEDTATEAREAAVEGLARLDDPESRTALRALTGPDRPVDLRIRAVAALAPLDPEDAAGLATALLNDLPASVDPAPLFAAFYRSAEGITAFTAAVEATPIPAAPATAGLKAAQSDLPWTLRSGPEAGALRAALAASGGVLPPVRMPQNLGPIEKDRLILDVKANADPARGEAVYRQAELQCTTCHTIGGAGGNVGPDLSSIGASAPTDYLIDALLEPARAVKDGYAMVRVETNDGQQTTGLLVRESSSEVVIRTPAGEERAFPVGQIRTHEILPGSLMPPGLTAPLERDAFIDLVGFLARLGETEAFTVPNDPYVRRWRVLQATDAAVAAAADGPAAWIRPDAPLPWQPAYSTVDGALPASDLPVLALDAGRSVSAAWFEVDVQAPGEATLRFDEPAGLSLWVGRAPVRDLGAETTVTFPEAGLYRLTVVVDRAVRGDRPLIVVLLDGDATTTRVRPVTGQ